MRIAEWIINNLNEHGNCYLPSNLFQLYSLEDVEKELTRLTGYDVEVRKSVINDYDMNYSLTGKNHRKNRIKKEVLYTAWKKEGEH